MKNKFHFKDVRNNPANGHFNFAMRVIIPVRSFVSYLISLSTTVHGLKDQCTVAFFGFFRCGEFTILQNFDPTTNLCVADVEIFYSTAITI
jgi:hypothetical protein